MNRDELKSWINKNLFRSDGALSPKKCKEEWFSKYNHEDIYSDLLNYTSFLDEEVLLSERLFYIVNDLDEPVSCEYQECNQKPDFPSFSMGYRDFCSLECAQRSEEIQEKIKETKKEKYGVKHHLQKEEFLEKQRQTVKEKYGVENVSQAEEVKRKKRETCQENFGVDTPFESEEVMERFRETCLEEYGVDNPMKDEDIKERARETRIKKEIKRIFESDRFKDRVKPLFDVEDYNGICDEYEFLCLKCNNKFTDNLRKGKVPRCYNCYPSKRTSKAEKEVFYFIDDLLDCEVKENVWNVIEDQELDIYIPEKNIAIEYDGLYYHSEFNGDCGKNYHLNKTKKCEAQNINLVHIFGDEWVNKQSIIKNRLRHLLGENGGKTIYARNCHIKEVSPEKKNQFLSKYHLQGEDRSKVKLGAFCGGDLVSVMTFSLPRIALGQNGSGEGVYEISRFCLGDQNVVGIAGKFLSYFEEKYNPNRLITYADRRWSSLPTLYDKLDFELESKTDPNYWYIKKENRYHRFSYRKNVLDKKLDEFDSSLSEWENMQLSGFDRIWDCGHLKYKKEF